jgi:hypothetical protein
VRGVCRWPSGQRRTHHSERLPPGESNGFACCQLAPTPSQCGQFRPSFLPGPRPNGSMMSGKALHQRSNPTRWASGGGHGGECFGAEKAVGSRSRRRSGGKRFFAGRAPPGRPSLWRPSARPPPYGGRRQLGFAPPHRLAVQPKRSHAPFCEVNLLEVEDSVAGRVEGLDSPAPAGSCSTTRPRSSVPGMSSASRPRLSVGGGRTIPPETNHHNPAPMRPQSSPRCRTHEWPPAPSYTQKLWRRRDKPAWRRRWKSSTSKE